MTGQLRTYDDDAFVRCSICGGDAAGPCAKCRRPVCGNCCVLVEGSAQKWAICTRCDAREGDKLSGWGSLGWFFVKIIVTLLAAVVLLSLLQK